MRRWEDIRRLPRTLRLLSGLGLLLVLAAIVTLVVATLVGVTTLRALVASDQIAPPPGGVMELLVVGMSLTMIGGALVWPTNMYRARLRRPGRGGLRLETWQEQVAAALALAALPLCVMIATLLLSPTTMPFASLVLVVGGALSVIEGFLLLAAQVWVIVVSLG